MNQQFNSESSTISYYIPRMFSAPKMFYSGEEQYVTEIFEKAWGVGKVSRVDIVHNLDPQGRPKMSAFVHMASFFDTEQSRTFRDKVTPTSNYKKYLPTTMEMYPHMVDSSSYWVIRESISRAGRQRQPNYARKTDGSSSVSALGMGTGLPYGPGGGQYANTYKNTPPLRINVEGLSGQTSQLHNVIHPTPVEACDILPPRLVRSDTYGGIANYEIYNKSSVGPIIERPTLYRNEPSSIYEYRPASPLHLPPSNEFYDKNK
jgi:hypothetical protein